MSPAYLGITPRPGDLVLLDETQPGNPFDGATWLRVHAVRPASHVAGWAYLSGMRITEESFGPEVSLFARLATLAVWRDTGTAAPEA